MNLPRYPFKLKRVEGQTQIFDEIRRKWLILTPEEWVRQHFVMYMNTQGYPLSLMAIERKLTLNGMTRRSDILAFQPSGDPYLLVECKAPGVPLSQEVLDQAWRYNSVLRVPYVLITNGIQHICIRCGPDGNQHYMDHLPSFESEE